MYVNNPDYISACFVEIRYNSKLTLVTVSAPYLAISSNTMHELCLISALQVRNLTPLVLYFRMFPSRITLKLKMSNGYVFCSIHLFWKSRLLKNKIETFMENNNTLKGLCL